MKIICFNELVKFDEDQIEKEVIGKRFEIETSSEFNGLTKFFAFVNSQELTVDGLPGLFRITIDGSACINDLPILKIKNMTYHG